MKLIRITIVFIILSVSCVHADSYSCEFMSIGAGARALGLGGAFVAIADDSTAAYWNPAGLCQLEQSELTLMHSAKFLQLAVYDCISYAQLLPIGTIGINWIRFSMGEIPRFPEPEGSAGQRRNSSEFRPSFNPEGYFSDTENALLLSFGKKFTINITPGLQLTKTWAIVGFGGTLKMISQALDENRSQGYGADFGIFFSMDAGSLVNHENIGEIMLGLNIQDVGTQVKWDTASQHKEIIPTNFKYGIAYSFNSNNHCITGALDRDTIYDGTTRFGLEYWYRSAIALRTGIESSGISFGFGVKKSVFAIDYAYLRQEIAGSHQLGATICF